MGAAWPEGEFPEKLKGHGNCFASGVRKNLPALSLESALTLQKGGHLSEAAAMYRQILTGCPDHADALHYLGMIAYHTGRLDEAVQLIGDSLRKNPNNAAALNNLGNALKDQRKYEGAITFYNAALAISPEYSQAHNNLGNVFKELGELDKAVECYRTALECDPKSDAAYCNLGVAFMAQGRPSQAVEAYRKALTLNRKSDVIHANLGSALRESGQYQEALDALDKALELNPNSEAGYVNKGATLRELGRLPEAIECQWRALKINPRSAMALNNLGNALRDQGCFPEAVAALRKALELQPGSDLALNNLGLTLNELGGTEEAVELFRRAIEAKPDNPMAYSNLLFALNYLPGTDRDTLFAEHQRFGHLFCNQLTRVAAAHRNDTNGDRALRVGFLSGDLRDHPVANFIEPVFATHNRREFEFHCYANQPVNDARTAELQQHVEHWRNVAGMTDDDLAAAIRQDGIDILVDLSGHTARNRLLTLARKPAPVQVTMIGYMQTTGLSAVDYRITDERLDPIGESERYSVEELVRLPAGAATFRPPANCPPVNELPALKNGYVTFASFNNLAKVTPEVVETWARILHRVPTARLLIVGRAGNSIAASLETFDIGGDRIEMVSRLPMAEYLELHHRVDILLDTFPYNGGTTTLLAAWMGVPFVTLAGSGSTGRAGAALLGAIGLGHLAANSVDEYLQKADDAARDAPALAVWRGRAREVMAPHFNDGSVFTRELEAAFRQMWRRWRARQNAEAIAA